MNDSSATEDGKQLLLSEFREKYLDALLRGSESESLQTIQRALDLGVVPKNIYLHVLMPAQVRIGELWHQGKVSIAQEHIATQITTTALGALRQRLKPRPPLGKRAVICSLSSDPHQIGGRVAADFLYMDGWEVDYLGSNTPAVSLVEFVEKKGADLVGISIALESTTAEAREAIRSLRALKPSPKILIGGHIARANPELVASLKPDGQAKDAQEAIDVARKLVDLPPASAYLTQYLAALGLRIQEHRKMQRLSQQQLAESSGLDRAYISAVEHGKHNLTLGAVMKLATALGTSLEELLIGER